MSLLENVAENFSVQETSVLKMSRWRATNMLQLQLCKTSVVHALKEHSLFARIHFCNWFLQCVYDAQFMFFCDETWFSWCGTVNSQSSWYWRVESPGLVHELPLHDPPKKKFGVSFAMSAHDEISTISGEEFQIVNKSIFCTECTQSRVQHSKFPLWHW